MKEDRKKENVLKIINHYGVLPQLKYFQSEVFELNEAIIRYENIPDGVLKPTKDKYKEHIAEETADVMVMLEQFKLYYDISSEDITSIFCEKVERQLERIEREKSTNSKS